MRSAERESILVADRLDRTTKEAMTAVLSRVNDCLYCGDMLVSLVHGGGKHEAASQIFSRKEEEIADPILRERLEWVKAVATPGSQSPADTPFTAEQLPEVIGSLLAMSHINRFSHVVMAGSPLKAPLGLRQNQVGGASHVRHRAQDYYRTSHSTGSCT